MPPAHSPFTVDLACPGTRDNAVTIKPDLNLNVGGLDDLRNIGTCPLYVGAVDDSGNVIADVQLAPGDSVTHFQPPTGAVSVYAVCERDCQGTAVLGYDDPDLTA